MGVGGGEQEGEDERENGGLKGNGNGYLALAICCRSVVPFLSLGVYDLSTHDSRSP